MVCQASRDESVAGFVPMIIRSFYILSMSSGLLDGCANIVPVFDSVVSGNHGECIAVRLCIGATECHDRSAAGAGPNALHQVVSDLDGMRESFVFESLCIDEGFNRIMVRDSPKAVDAADQKI